MHLVPLQSSLIRIDSSKLHIFAEVVPALLAEEAVIAWHAGFYRDSVTLFFELLTFERP